MFRMSLENEWVKQEYLESEEETKHRPVEVEYAFYKAVKTGVIEYVQKNLDDHEFTNPEGVGQLSSDPIQSLKYHFVITAAMVTRHCVDSGLDPEQAYRLSDFYIRKLDHCHSQDAVSQIHHTMILDFTKRMRMLQKETIISKPINDCTDYIYQHINERITIQDLADHVNLSCNYLSRLFKQNLGISASDYIRTKKIEKAENLLKYSNFSYIEISNYLAFSSQSHFIQAFEKQTCMTPKKYRDKYHHSAW